MSDQYVFDTEALIAYLYNEPGHERVADLLSDVLAAEAGGFLTETNASEVFYLIARFEGIDDTQQRSRDGRQPGICVRLNGRGWRLKQPTGGSQPR